jgi:hypothetical protein
MADLLTAVRKRFFPLSWVTSSAIRKVKQGMRVANPNGLATLR